MNVLPQSRQAAAEQAIGLLRRVPADQYQLAKGNRDFTHRHRWQARQQIFGAFEAEAVERHFKVFCRFRQAAVGVAVGLAHHAQHQGRTALHQLGNISQRTAIIADGFAHAVVAGLGNRQPDIVQALDPSSE